MQKLDTHRMEVFPDLRFDDCLDLNKQSIMELSRFKNSHKICWLKNKLVDLQ